MGSISLMVCALAVGISAAVIVVSHATLVGCSVNSLSVNINKCVEKQMDRVLTELRRNGGLR